VHLQAAVFRSGDDCGSKVANFSCGFDELECIKIHLRICAQAVFASVNDTFFFGHGESLPVWQLIVVLPTNRRFSGYHPLAA
jgi:hypothetical protein